MAVVAENKRIDIANPVEKVVNFPLDNRYKSSNKLFVSEPQKLPYYDYATLAASFIIWVHRMTGEEVLHIDLHRDGIYHQLEVELRGVSTAEIIIDSVKQSLKQKGRKEPSYALTFSDSWIRSEGSNLQFSKSGDYFYFSGLESIINESCEDRYVESFKLLSMDVINYPKKDILDLNILTVEDKNLWNALNNTSKAYSIGRTLHSVFSNTVSLYPYKIAISSESGSITFADLEHKSNEVANFLYYRGVKVGDYVSVYMERSIDTIIAMLGVMKAGAVYVPLSPENPKNRTEYIIEDSKSKMVLTQDAYVSELKEMLSELNTPIISLKSIKAESTPICVDMADSDLAYIIYTSGSTGNPKGVKIKHKSIVGFGYALTDIFPTTPDDVLTQFYTLTFDASFLEICPMLFTGARIHMLSKDERVDVTSFANMLKTEGITYITAFPVSVLKQFSIYATDEEAACFSTLKVFGVGGEALTGEVVRLFQNKFGMIDVINLYGPTECTVIASIHRISGPVEENMINIPIGKPINNYKMYIVNENMNLCPIGVEGELLIETEGVSEGYLNLSQKTAEVFVKTHLTDNLVYRSGDVAKLLPDGGIEFLGRKDLQVKVRGYRVEIGEIEDALSQSNFTDNVAVVAKDINGDKMLAAYYSTKEGLTIKSKTLVNYLAARLPSYMIPSYFIELKEVPLSSTGKVDRKYLTSLPLIEVETNSKKRPSNVTEEKILEAWKKVLGINSIGVNENFFELGGHSLKVLGVLSLLKKEFPILKINDFFTYPTIELLAQKVANTEIENNHLNHRKIVELCETELYEHPVKLRSDYSLKLVNQTNILLTGVTGYLGSHLLIDLVKETQSCIYALVRGKDQLEAELKLKSTLDLYAPKGFYEDYNVFERVKVVVGDFSKNELGLSDEDKLLLEKRINSIIHCGADVRHFGDKQSFLKSNVKGTENLLKLATKLDNCRFHYISTIGIPEDLAMEGYWDEFLKSDNISTAPSVSSLYTDSRLESEKLVESYYKNGLPVTILRPGNISCQYGTGIFQKNIDSNAVYRMLKSFILLGKAPSVKANMDFTMVDYASKAIVGVITEDESIGGVFHICNPTNLAYLKLIDHLQSYGYKLDLLSPEDFESWLHSDEPKDKEGLELAMTGLEGDGAQDSPLTYACPQTTKIINAKGIFCPEPDEKFIHRMLDHAVKVGYLPKANNK